MSKIIFVILCSVLFTAFAIPTGVYAQESSSGLNKTVQTEIKKDVTHKTATLQDLQSKLTDQYGVDGFRFVKNGELKEMKNQKTLGAKELSAASGLDEYTIIIILAAIGAIAVILFIFK